MCSPEGVRKQKRRFNLGEDRGWQSKIIWQRSRTTLVVHKGIQRRRVQREAKEEIGNLERRICPKCRWTFIIINYYSS